MASRRKPLVLVVDDESDIRTSLRMILEYEGYALAEASSGEQTLDRLETERPDVVLLDIKMPRMDGLELLARIKQSDPALPVVVISGHGTIATAVEATRLGAFDFMEKPLERDRVLLVVRNALDSGRLERENRDLKLTFEERFKLIGSSAAMKAVQDQIALAAPTKASVLVTGESGTGKELVARAIHRNSARATEAFVKVNCAAIPEELIESELFGHEKGSFTGAMREQTGKFAQADGGTIFLDEIADMSLRAQSKVLRALQDGEIEPVGAAKSFVVDVRVIAATNKNLEDEIAQGRFREDLFFRLNVLPIRLPSLRERREDVAPLVAWFAESFCREHGLKPKTVATDAIEALSRLRWRGNVRELRNAIERLVIMTPGSAVRAADLPASLDQAPMTETSMPLSAPGAATLQEFKDAAERAFIIAKLAEHDWNVAATAKAIDTPRSNLYKKLEAYGIRRETDG
jgi:two-component system nitrogen regulation response regulator NtrX